MGGTTYFRGSCLAVVAA